MQGIELQLPMKILITDDAQARYSQLVERLIENGIDRESICFAVSRSQAVEMLEKEYFDLLLLDLLIPMWPGYAADNVQNSLSILEDINQDLLIRPGHIIGITSDKTLLTETGGNFQNSTWRIVEYSPANNEWIDTVISSVSYLNKNTNKIGRSDCENVDLAIICALQSPELNEVLKLPWNWSAAEPISDQIFVSKGNFNSNNKNYSVIATTTDQMGMVSAALLSQSIISFFCPKAIVMTGICAGVEGRVKGGDILLADPVWDYQSGKLVADEDGVAMLKCDPTQLHADPVVVSQSKNFFDQKIAMKILANFHGDATHLTMPNVKIGPVASGSMVLSDGATIKSIQDVQHRKLLGVEMEIFGMYAAVNSSPCPRPKVFALKAVCDFGDSKKGDDYQTYAAYTSAKYLQLLMESKAENICI